MRRFDKNGIKRRLVTALELPKDVTLGLPVVNMMGGEEIFVDNHKGILEYSVAHIRIATSVGVLRVCGEELLLRQMTHENIAIAGKIEKVLWEA